VTLLRVAVGVPLALFLLAACGRDGSAKPPAGPSWIVPSAPPASAPATPFTGDPAKLAAAMGDADLAGQVLMPYAFGNSATGVDKSSAVGNRSLAGVDTPAEMVRKFRLGGLILVGFTPGDPTGQTNPTTNVDSPAQVRSLTAGLQAASPEVPLLIGTDQEYGVVTRVKSGMTALPAAMAFGAAGKPALTEAAWRAAGTELAAMGINVDFAPVADTLGPRGNAAIGSRAFGGDAKANAAQVAAAVRGIQDAGIAAAIKHFPGHGHTTGDSHDELPVVAQSRSAWESQDLPPFRSGIAAGAGMVMSGHLDVKALDPGVPASFSHKVMTDELRGRLKFTGVAITDAMNMTPAMKWPPGEAAVRALNAGNDMLLMPSDITKARDGILAGLKDGSLPRARLVEAVTRILTLKMRNAAEPQPALSTLSSPDHRKAVLAADAASITVLRGKCSGPPVAGPVTVTASEGRNTARTTLVRALQAAGVTVQSAGGAIVHLVGYGDRSTDLNPRLGPSAPSGGPGAGSDTAAAVTVMMDTPYLLSDARSPTLIATYSSSALSLIALADVLAGKAKAPGRSPVAVSGLPRTAC
jgi:beta-N-acetylhexosaminidase